MGHHHEEQYIPYESHRRTKKVAESLFEEIMAEKFPNMREMDI